MALIVKGTGLGAGLVRMGVHGEAVDPALLHH
jgi:hypothetical protein